MTELLKQPQFRPLSVGEQVIVIYAGTNGFIDAIPVSQVNRWEKEFLEFLSAKHSGIVVDIETKKALDDEIKKRIDGIVKDFNAGFQA